MKPEFAHPSFDTVEASRAAVEECWQSFWLPSITVDGKVSLEKLKGELFDAYHLIMTAPRVYRYATGGITDDACASYEGMVAAIDRHVAARVEVAMNEQLQREKLKARRDG